MTPLTLGGCATHGDRASWATISDCGRYRYALGRAWDPAPEDHWDAVRPVFSIVMLNPSTADGTQDDPTIRKCIHFAKQEGCGALLVRNLFAYRATDPDQLRDVLDPYGPLNDHVLEFRLTFALKVAAWGALTKAWLRRRALVSIARVKMCTTLHVLGLTDEGYDRSSIFASHQTRQPRHPLYLANATRARPWREVAEEPSQRRAAAKSGGGT